MAAVPYRPPGSAAPARSRNGFPLLPVLLGGLLLFAALVGAFFFFARSVQFEIVPAGARLSLDGGVGISMGSGYLVLPGEARLRAKADGYEDLAADVVIGDEPQQKLRFEMTRLPGSLTLITEPAAEVFIDGNPRGSTPMPALELAAGTHQLLLRAPRYQAHQAELKIEGGGVAQTLKIDLVPGWAPVSLRSKPSGAAILVDGQPQGLTPQTLELGAGVHAISLQLAGYATWRDSITVTANQPLNLAEARLLPAEGVVRLSSTPSGASVRVGKDFRGQTPIELRLAPGKTHLIQLSAPGHKAAERSVEVSADDSQSLNLALEPILGSIALDVQPADAAVKIDGRPVAAGTTRLDLVTVAHTIEATKSGYAPWSGSVTPRPGLEQRVEIRLNSEAEARAARNPAKLTSKGGPNLVLVQPGSYVMGTPRGEQGRQSNEAQRPVKLSRAYYLSTTEITNQQFRRFAAAHSSGIIRRETLDNERQPVARVTWMEAARYCNWLSQQDGLPAAYREDGATMQLVQPLTTGYRLPSEAEWEWAARHAGGNSAQRYSWGSGFPPPPKSGNFADPTAESVAPQVLDGYEDGYAAASPVATYPANALGLFDLGGNVAEWMHDLYDATLPINPPEAVDPFGAATGTDHVIRGSSWLHGRLVELRLAFRDMGHDERPDLGFRVARYAE
ncbi:hypothetical protein B1810_11555 [Panacagrimonas perspica]|nr:hypothetical protein B1810_11555 [Panacagrimonas perspica]